MSNDRENYLLLNALRRDTLKKYAESLTHKRLRIILDKEADSRGFTKVYSKLGDGKPDVIREDPTGCLYIGDAKVEDNEGPGKLDTLDRILGYILDCTIIVIINNVICTFTIATNKIEAAKEWCNTLSKCLNVYKDIGLVMVTECTIRSIDVVTHVVECTIKP